MNIKPDKKKMFTSYCNKAVLRCILRDKHHDSKVLKFYNAKC